ncbi:MAG: HD domain-containing phosphohydrolase [Planctomycetota bacterium]
MNDAPTMKVTTANEGRLPCEESPRPLSAVSFKRLAEHWRALSVWLTLWDTRGGIVSVDTDGRPPWTAFWEHGGEFREELGRIAREVCDSSKTGGSGVAGGVPGPWHPDIGVMAAPVRRRHRVVGVVLGVTLLTDRPGEAFARLCTQCELASEHTAHTASHGPLLQRTTFTAAEGLLRLSVEQTRALEVAEEETSILTRNLENTYEEQHLIYQVSEMIGLPKRPVEVFESVGRALLEVARARGVAFVLTERESSSPSQVNGGEFRQDIRDRIAQTGEGAPSLTDLARLSECLGIDAASPVPYLLLNEAGERTELAWARDWLRHLVALPLWHEKKLLGILLAINCIDEGDFTSVDVQLFRAVADRVSAFLENQHLYDDLSDLLMGMLHALVNSIDAKDPYTCGHSERVAYISRWLAQARGMATADCERVYLAGLLHDIGKIGVPDAVLCKPGKLTKEEFGAMKRHPDIGAKILSRVRQVADLVPGVLRHHERMDGRGYPAGISDRHIPLLGRIICLADCFDAMTTNRTYRVALPLPTVEAEIRRCSGTQFDPKLADLFVQSDLVALLKEAHGFSGAVSDLGQQGALHAVMGNSGDVQALRPEAPRMPAGVH